jgi:hypothetical protein
MWIHGSAIALATLLAGATTALAQPHPAAPAAHAAGTTAGDTGQHPAYLHALEDIKSAQSAIQARGGSPSMKSHEKTAVQQTEAAQYIIYAQLGPEEKKSTKVLPANDVDPSKSIGGLHDAKAYLQKALADCSEAESDKAVADQRHREIILLQAAMGQVDQAIDDFAHHR